MNDVNYLKKKAALAAVKHVKTDQVIGIGSAEIIELFIEFLRERMITENLKIKAIPTSYRSAYLLIHNQIPLTTLNEYPEPDIAVDGADEVDSKLNMIKSESVTFTHEKIIDSMAKKFIVIADDTKKVEYLGRSALIPIEIIPMALKSVMRRLKAYNFEFKLRERLEKTGPVITGNRNFIIDAKMSQIKDIKQLELELNGIPGVIENGLFVEIVDTVYLGSKKGVIELVK